MQTNANFVDAVANGQEKACPQCGAKNQGEANNCEACGVSLTAGEPAFAPVALDNTPKEEAAPAFAPAVKEESSENKEAAPAFAPVEQKPEKPYVEPESVFAQGLPAWSLEPPQVVVRRHGA